MTRRTSRRRTSLRRNSNPGGVIVGDTVRSSVFSGLAKVKKIVGDLADVKHEHGGTFAVSLDSLFVQPKGTRATPKHLRRNSRRTSRRRTSLRRNASSIANTFFTVFAGILTQEDQKMMAKETKRGGYGNIYRLGHYLKALHRVEESVQGFKGDDVSTMIQVRIALEMSFTGSLKDKLCKPVDAYLEHGTLPKYPVQKLAKNGLLDACTYCKASPGGKHKWWCKKLAKNFRKRTSRRRR